MSHSEKLVRWLAETGIRGDHVPLDDLAAVPTTVSVAGIPLVADSDLWRDFQPICPPNGQPMIALVRVQASRPAALPVDLTAERIAVIHERTVWVAQAVNERPAEHATPFMEVIARNGPTWGPGVAVDLIIQLRDAEGRMYLLRVPTN